MRTLAVAMLLAAFASSPAALAEPDGAPAPPPTLQVVPLAPMTVPRAAHQATLLESGQVLVTGGCAGACDVTHRSAERYDPASRSFDAAGSMAVARNSHAAVALHDGRVLVVGGWEERRATASAELFDPAGESFKPANEMTEARAVPVAVRLADGRVLIIGGQTSELAPLSTAELFDPATTEFARTGSMTVPRIGHAAVALDDGRVLVTGGLPERRGRVLRSAEIYDPRTGTFKPTGDMTVARMKHAAVRLGDGRVLLVGGSDEGPRSERHRSTEIFDPASGTFEPGPQMAQRRYKLPDAVVVLRSGAVLVAGGAAQPELLPAGAAQFQRLKGKLDGPHEFATATVLPDGNVLVLGGYDEEIRTSDGAWLVAPED